MTSADRQAISAFLSDLHRDLEGMILEPARFVPEQLLNEPGFERETLLAPRLREVVAPVWPRFEERLTAAVEQLEMNDQDTSLDQRLAAFGLTGIELQMKIELYARLREPPPAPDPRRLWPEARRPREERIRDQRRRWWRRLIAGMSRALKVANIILGSLVAAGLPAFEPVKEVKDAIEAALEDSSS